MESFIRPASDASVRLRVVAVALVAAAALPRPISAQSGSGVPCVVPLEWQIGAIDPRFGLNPEDALAAAKAGGALWENAVGRELFRFGAARAAPIVFEFDERQAEIELRRNLRDRLDAQRAVIDRRRSEIEGALKQVDTLERTYLAEASAHTRAVEAFNREVTRWAEQGGAPDDVRAQLEARKAVLDADLEQIRELERAYRGASDRVQEAIASYNRDADELQTAEERFVRDYPADVSESGRYDERVLLESDRPVAVQRRIRVFQFRGLDDLAVVIAHELGHALGLGHAEQSGAVMSEVMVSVDTTNRLGSVTPADVAMLAARCPAVVRQRAR